MQEEIGLRALAEGAVLGAGLGELVAGGHRGRVGRGRASTSTPTRSTCRRRAAEAEVLDGFTLPAPLRRHRQRRPDRALATRTTPRSSFGCDRLSVGQVRGYIDVVTLADLNQLGALGLNSTVMRPLAM
jgi:hypothetical protein